MYSRYSESLPAIHVNAGLIHLQHKFESSRAAQTQPKMVLSASRQQFLACESRDADLQYERRRGGYYVSRCVCWLFVVLAITAIVFTGITVYLMQSERVLQQNPSDMWRESDPMAQLEGSSLAKPLRLSNAVVPSFYRLKLTPRLDKSTFSGEVYITLRTNAQNVNKITLHSKDLNINDKVTVTEQAYEKLRTNKDGDRKKRQVADTASSIHTNAAGVSSTTDAINPDSGQSITEKTTENDVFSNITPLNEVDNVDTQVTHGNTRNIRVTSKELDRTTDRLTLNLETALKPGMDYILELAFNGNITDNLNGFYRSTYMDGQSLKVLAITQFEPTYARAAFPCFDEPQFKAMFEISIAHPDAMTALSNMPVASREPFPGTLGWSWTHFDRSVKMSTYLVAYAVLEFEHVETSYLSKDNVTKPIRVWARAEHIHNAAYALNIVPKLLEFYEDLFGVPYALTKLDLVAVPDFASSAMENWGLITFRETTLLYDELTKVAHDKQGVAVDVAHELAHQWFGNLVTMRWWTDLWLNEGFATYVEYVGVNHLAPEWNTLDSFTRDKMELLRIDALKHTMPVSKVVTDASEITQKFDEISYTKGASLIRMLNHTITEELFHKGLVAYLKKWAYMNAVEDDLWVSMSEVTADEPSLRNVSVVQFMNTWTKQAGYPVVAVYRDYDTGQVHFRQNLFTTVATPFPSHLEHIWHIPISYTAVGSALGAWDTAPKLWLNQRELTVTVPINRTDAIYVNVDSIGYYRVNYDATNWDLISKALKANEEIVPSLARSQFIDDAFNLAKVSSLPYRYALELTTYLEHRTEGSRTVWDMVLSNLSFLKFMLQKTPYYSDFQDYALRILNKTLKKHNYGLDAPRDDDEEWLMESLLMWECYAESPRCLAWAQGQFRQWMDQPDSRDNPIPSYIRNVVYSVALRHGGRPEFDFLWRVFQNSSDPNVKTSAAGTLGSTRDPALIRLLLERSLTVVPNQYAPSMWGLDSVVGSAIAQELFTDQWHRIHDKFSKVDPFVFESIISGTFGYITTDRELNKFKEFVERHSEAMRPHRRSVLKLVDSAGVRIAWLRNHAERIGTWLREHKQTSPADIIASSTSDLPKSEDNSTTSSPVVVPVDGSTNTTRDNIIQSGSAANTPIETVTTEAEHKLNTESPKNENISNLKIESNNITGTESPSSQVR